MPLARLSWGQSASSPALAAGIYQPALALARGKTKLELGLRLGEALAAQGKWAQALPVLLPVATTPGQWSTRAGWMAGQALENTGAKGDALALYGRVAGAKPADEWTAKAAARAKELGS